MVAPSCMGSFHSKPARATGEQSRHPLVADPGSSRTCHAMHELAIGTIQQEVHARAQIIILSGPPGSGKSTVAPLVAYHFDHSVVLPMDDFFHFIRKGHIARFLSDAAPQNEVVTGVLAAAAARFASAGYTVILGGIVGPWFLAIYLEAALLESTEVHYFVLRPSSDIALARAVSRRPNQLTDPEPVAGLYAALSDLGAYESHVVDSSHWDPLHDGESRVGRVRRRRLPPDCPITPAVRGERCWQVGLPRPARGADGSAGVWARTEVLNVRKTDLTGGRLPVQSTSDRHEVYLGWPIREASLCRR